MSGISSHEKIQPERRAWYILLTSFFVFLILLGLAIYGIQHYIFLSERDLGMNLIVASGTVTLNTAENTEAIAVEDMRESLQPSLQLTTGANSQALLTFHTQAEETILTEFRIFRETTLLIEKATTPRFLANGQPLTINASITNGKCNLQIPETMSFPIDITLDTPFGSLSITSPGEYGIEINESSLILESNGENAVFIRDGFDEQTVLNQSSVLQYDPGNDEMTSLTANSLLSNGEFDVPADIGWDIYNDDLTDPEGLLTSSVERNQSIIIFDRSQANWPDILLGHGETGITQVINKDVSESVQIIVRVKLLIEEQSLPLCGERGSECPLMLRISYRDESGEDREIITGLFANNSTTPQFPNTCDSCRTEHIRIRMNSWYVYDSENLLTRLPEEIKPDFIKSLTVYASGHAYRVKVDEISFVSFES